MPQLIWRTISRSRVVFPPGRGDDEGVVQISFPLVNYIGHHLIGNTGQFPGYSQVKSGNILEGADPAPFQDSLTCQPHPMPSRQGYKTLPQFFFQAVYGTVAHQLQGPFHVLGRNQIGARCRGNGPAPGINKGISPGQIYHQGPVLAQPDFFQLGPSLRAQPGQDIPHRRGQKGKYLPGTRGGRTSFPVCQW